MVIFQLIFDFLNVFFLLYAALLFLSYLGISLLSYSELNAYLRKNKHFNYRTLYNFKVLPSISVIAPAYNEELSIIENIRSLLSLNYPRVEVIIVNDGSTDNSMEKIIQHYDLVKVNYAFEKTIPAAEVRGIYKSTQPAYSNLIIVDKENGGKADALNVGINVSRSDLYLAVDVDSIIEQDALLRMVKPFLEENEGEKVIASGGVIRVANSCKVKDGRITEVRFPRNLWARYQVLEYIRSFTLGRMAWSKINGLLIISGAFGLFDKKIVKAVGGYDTSTVGEDLELIVRMRKYMHTIEKMKYKVAFIPDPLCWTEVPSTIKILTRQRSRWTRGSIDTILKHKDMFFNPKYGRIGLFSYPYWVFFEWLAPLIETFGLLYFLLMIMLGTINFQIFIILLLYAYAFSFAFSTFASFSEIFTFNRYKGYSFIFNILLVAATEMFVFSPLNIYFSLVGNYDYFIKKKKGWGVMTRTAFDSKNK